MRQDGARYHDLDALRATAMLLGIVFHAALSFFAVGGTGAGWPTESRVLEVAFGGLVYVLHAFRLELFFLLAGFFAALVVARRGGSAFTRQRLHRIGLPLVVGVLTIVPLVHLAEAWLQDRRGGLASPELGAVFHVEPVHLWFLWYLLLFYAGALALRRWLPAVLRRGTTRAFGELMRSRLRLPVLVALSALLLVPATGWSAATPQSFVPALWPLLFYGLFFAVGWLLHGRPDALDAAGRHAGWQLTGAALTSIAVVALLESTGQAGGLPGAVGIGLTALLGWLATFGLLGLGRRLLVRERAWVRYLADASYWMYLAHLPLVLALQALLVPARLPMPATFVVILLVTGALLLASYELLVRHSVIGRTLNGVRPPRRRHRSVETVPATA